MGVHILTFATNDDRAQYLNCPGVINLGATKKWKGDFRDKVRAVADAVRSLPQRDLVCFVDAYDVVTCNTDPVALAHKFESLAADVVFSAETNCYPWPEIRDVYPFAPGFYKYLNSGGYMGRAGALRQLLTDPTVLAQLDQAPCDQGFFTCLYFNSHCSPHPGQKLRMALDQGCSIFQSAYGVPWSHFEVREGVFWNVVTKTQPHFVHFNGNTFLTEDDASIMPVLWRLLRERGTANLGADHVQKYPTVRPRETDGAIVALARRRAASFVPPDQARIPQRDWDNQHAILRGTSFVTTRIPKDFQEEFSVTSRQVVEAFLRRVGASCDLLLDVVLHDYLGRQHNTAEWPHSILGYSTEIDDTHNVCIPDRYAMQNYDGALARVDGLPTVCKRNRLLFIGSSTGKLSLAENHRVQLCRFAAGRDWIDAHLSAVVNFDPPEAAALQEFVRPAMSFDEQRQVRHLIVVDGNTACWDRLPWILASKCVCWKMESAHQCWYYEFLKPWVHYVPFTLDTLEATWEAFKDDEAAQRRMVRNANAFAEAYLRPDAHALYTRVLLDDIGTKQNLSSL